MKRQKIISIISVATFLITSVLSFFTFGYQPTKAVSTILAPGVYDDLSNDTYYDFSIRGTWKDTDDYEWNNQAGYDSTYAPLLNTDWGEDWPKLLGSLMGEPVTKAFSSNSAWNGSSLVYMVEENTYIATALVMAPADIAYVDRYEFEVSADGTAWTDVVADVALSSSATAGESYYTVYRAVVQIPAGMSYYRVTLPGFNYAATTGNEYTYALMDADSLHMCFGGSFASDYDITQYNTMSEVPEFKEPILAPGIYDGLADDYYYDFFIRGTWKDTDDYEWNNQAGYDSTYAPLLNTDWGEGWPKLLGSLMGEPVTKAFSSNSAWNGSSLVYMVEENTYIATALVMVPADIAYVDRYEFEVSADGTAWTDVVADVALSSSATAGESYYTVYRAVVQIPAGMSYYRVTLPGFNYAATTGNEYTYALMDADSLHMCFGGSFASSYNLAEYEFLSDVPDSPFFVDKTGDLAGAVAIAEAINLNAKADDAAKTEFIAALEAARLILEDSSAVTQEDINTATARLNSAIADLNAKGIPADATIGQNDERLILKPGVADWLNGSVFLDQSQEPVTSTDGVHVWYACYTDYALTGLISTLDNRYLESEKYFHATNYDLFLYDDLKLLNFMGRPVERIFINTISWAASNVTYKVYAGSYLASSIVVNTNSPTSETFTDIQNDYVFQVSADGTVWEDVTATLTEEQTAGDYILYKAVIQVPEDRYLCRIIMPKAMTNTPDTGWYQSPSYAQTFLGATIASMNNLSQYSSFDAIPDATEWYADAVLASTDEELVTLTEEYFKCMAADMTVAQAIAALDLSTAGVAFYTAEGVKITEENTVLEPGMKVDILDSKGISLSSALGLQMLTVASGTDLLTIDPIADIEVANGAAKTVEGLNLPATTRIEAGNGEFDAAIVWDMENSDYDSAITQQQIFTVTGTITLPSGVTNGGAISLEVMANVTVLATEEIDIISTDETKATINKDTGIIYVKQGLTLGELLAVLNPVGESYIFFADADGNDIDDMDTMVAEGMTVDVYSSVVLMRSYEVKFLAAADADNPSTGDSGIVLTFAILTLLAGSILLSSRKRARVR